MKNISIVTNCFNEEGNILDLYKSVKAILDPIPWLTYDHIFIDNASTDNTVDILRTLAEKDKSVKVILNTRNFGQIRSGNYALLEATGDAVIHLVADLQDPPELIPRLLEKWQEGYPIVIGQKCKTKDGWTMAILRGLFYRVIGVISEVPQIESYTGFGLYDKKVIDTIRSLKDPYPYFRGLISELGFDIATIKYEQPARQHGITTHNFYSLYDIAILGITNHSKVPLRLATFLGFSISLLSALAGLFYLFYKLM